jgi:hypothetical protein
MNVEIFSAKESECCGKNFEIKTLMKIILNFYLIDNENSQRNLKKYIYLGNDLLSVIFFLETDIYYR